MISDRQTWPELRFTWHMLPWHWRVKPRFFMDDIEKWRYITVAWMGMELQFSANKPLFFEPKTPPDFTIEWPQPSRWDT